MSELLNSNICLIIWHINSRKPHDSLSDRLEKPHLGTWATEMKTVIVAKPGLLSPGPGTSVPSILVYSVVSCGESGDFSSFKKVRFQVLNVQFTFWWILSFAEENVWGAGYSKQSGQYHLYNNFIYYLGLSFFPHGNHWLCLKATNFLQNCSAPQLWNQFLFYQNGDAFDMRGSKDCFSMLA